MKSKKKINASTEHRLITGWKVRELKVMMGRLFLMHMNNFQVTVDYNPHCKIILTLLDKEQNQQSSQH